MWLIYSRDVEIATVNYNCFGKIVWTRPKTKKKKTKNLSDSRLYLALQFMNWDTSHSPFFFFNFVITISSFCLHFLIFINYRIS